MFEFRYLIFLCYLTNSVISDHQCNNIFYKDDKPITNMTEYCSGKTKPCLVKCCRMNEVYNVKKQENEEEGVPTCTDWKSLNINPNFTIFNIYLDNATLSKKKFLTDFDLVENKLFQNVSCLYESFNSFASSYQILQNGSLTVWIYSTDGKEEYLFNSSEFCVDLQYYDGSEETPVAYYAVETSEDPQKIQEKTLFNGITLVISLTFMVPVLLVYCVLPERRNLAGTMLMAYLCSLFSAYMLKVIHVFFYGLVYINCQILAPLLYFSILSTFFWLNIMSFDIWRVIRRQRVIGTRTNDLVKLRRYICYGFGAPLLLTVAVVIIDKNIPEYGPQFELCISDAGTLRYIHIPIGILTFINMVLLLMTFYNIWMVKNEFNGFKDSKNNQNKLRFTFYAKMSMMMGMSWILEVVAGTCLKDPSLTEYILINFYNDLIGVFIFFLFVFNKATLKQLCKRFDIQCRYNENKSVYTSGSTMKSSTNKDSKYGSRTTELYELPVVNEE